MERLEADTDPDPHAKAERLVGLEADYLDAYPDMCRADPALAASRGHPVLAEGSHWRDLARISGAPEAAREADDLIERLIEGEAQRWREKHGEGRGEPVPDRCFRDLADARAFDLEALSRRMDTRRFEFDLVTDSRRRVRLLELNPILDI